MGGGGELNDTNKNASYKCYKVEMRREMRNHLLCLS